MERNRVEDVKKSNLLAKTVLIREQAVEKHVLQRCQALRPIAPRARKLEERHAHNAASSFNAVSLQPEIGFDGLESVFVPPVIAEEKTPVPGVCTKLLYLLAQDVFVESRRRSTSIRLPSSAWLCETTIGCNKHWRCKADMDGPSRSKS